MSIDANFEPVTRRCVTLVVQVVHCRYPAWKVDAFASRSAAAWIGLSFTGQRCAVATAERVRDCVVEPDSLLAFGAGPPDWLRVDRPSELVEVSAAPEWRHALADELRCPDADLADLAINGDAVGWSVIARMRILLLRREAVPLRMEELAQRLFAHVYVRRFGGREPSKGHGRLDGRRLARVRDYIADHPGGLLDLATLAEVAALSPYHFHRASRSATGCTLHGFVAMWRAREARQAIEGGVTVPTIMRRHGLDDARQLRRLLASWPPTAP